jgi:YesN/AraC family two-component response regulator
MRVWDEHCYPVAYVKKMLLIIFGIIARMDISIQVMLEDPNIWVNRILCDCKNYHDLEQKMSEQYELWINDQCIKPGSHKEIADQIEKYLRLHIYGNLTMQDIADEFKLSASYISRIMKKYYNISPIEYYNKLKIVEAKRLITEHQEMLIKEIAEILGFYDQHYFSKVFKKYHGLSPLEYKYGPELRKNGS